MDRELLRGVNLGGWLVLEKWITPSLFNGLNAEDEYSFVKELGTEAEKKLGNHYESYITDKDFKWIADNRLSCVRIQVGYWLFGDEPPFVGNIKYLDYAFEQAVKYNLKILIDLHGAPGSQNGLDHSGKIGLIDWVKDANIDKTLDIICQITKRYANHKSFWGLNLINEPGWSVSIDLLKNFYDRGYKMVRDVCGDSVAVVISDAFRPLKWNDFLNNPKYKNLILDVHLYQCFSPKDKALSLKGHLKKTNKDWVKIINKNVKQVIIGEWSLGLDPSTFDGMSKSQEEEALKSFAVAQIKVFDNAADWFFWTYKTENMRGWNYRKLFEEGIINF